MLQQRPNFVSGWYLHEGGSWLATLVGAHRPRSGRPEFLHLWACRGSCVPVGTRQCRVLPPAAQRFTEPGLGVFGREVFRTMGSHDKIVCTLMEALQALVEGGSIGDIRARLSRMTRLRLRQPQLCRRHP